MNNSIENVIQVSQNPVQKWFDSFNYLLALILLVLIIGLWAIWAVRREYRERDEELDHREVDLNNSFVAPKPEFLDQKSAQISPIETGAVAVAAGVKRKKDDPAVKEAKLKGGKITSTKKTSTSKVTKSQNL